MGTNEKQNFCEMRSIIEAPNGKLSYVELAFTTTADTHPGLKTIQVPNHGGFVSDDEAGRESKKCVVDFPVLSEVTRVLSPTDSSS